MFIDMKKNIYNAPACEFVEWDIDTIMETTSPWDTPSQGEGGVGWFSDGQESNQHVGGSWENIWNE